MDDGAWLPASVARWRIRLNGHDKLDLVELRLVFVGSALITGGERFRHAGDVTGFHEEEIAHPRDRQRHDLVFVFKDKTKTLAFGESAQFSYQGFERPMRSYIKYVIRHPAIITASRAFGKPGPVMARLSRSRVHCAGSEGVC